jgi:hypothetical protein
VSTKTRLHELIDAMPEDRLGRVEQLLVAVLDDDPLGLSLALAPLDDEPEGEAERAAVAEALDEVERGKGKRISAEEIYREFGV